MTVRVRRAFEFEAPAERVWEFISDPGKRADAISVVRDYEVDGNDATWQIDLQLPLVDRTATVETEDGDAPLYVRNDVSFSDCRLDEGESVTLPARAGRDTYCYVFEGGVTIDGGAATLGHTESALVVGERAVEVTATEDSVLVAFCLDPDAPITRQPSLSARSL